MMNRRHFFKWIVGATVSLATTLFLPPEVVLTLSEPSAPKQTGEVLASENALHIAVLTDLHTQLPHFHRDSVVYNQKATRAINDMLTLDPDLFVLIGDVVHHGFPEEYAIVKNMLRPVQARKIPLYMSMGNHEFYNHQLTDNQARALFAMEFGLKEIFTSIVKDNVHVVLLSPEYRAGAWRSRDWARLSDAQLKWFDQVLSEHRDKVTLVCLHQPLNDTVEQSQYVDWIARTEQTPQLLSIAMRHPQIKCWVSGHTHAPLAHTNQIVYRHGIWFVGGASSFYTNNIWPKRGPRTGPYLGRLFDNKLDFSANESRFVSVYRDKIVIRARDHTSRQWMDHLNLTIPLKR